MRDGKWYAVGADSKRHVLYTWQKAPLGDENWILKEADTDGWIKWRGGECPLPDGSVSDIRYRYPQGKELHRVWPAEDTDWREVVAYRPILDVEPDEMTPEVAQYAKAWREHYGESCEPEAPAWSGEWLPPVGVECDCYHTGTHQGVVTVRYMGSEMCVLLNHDRGEEQCGPIDAYSFRPIRSEEDRLIEEAMSLIGVEPDEHGAESVVFRMIRAGYRKTGGES